MNDRTLNILLDRCFQLAKLSNCQKRQFGSVIVPSEILNFGHSDPCKTLDEVRAYGVNHTYDWEECNPCLRANIPSGTEMGLCRAIHAEQAAIIQFMTERKGNLEEHTLVVAGRRGKEKLLKKEPGFYCTLCSRLISAVGLDGVVVPTLNGPAFLSVPQILDYSYRVASGAIDAGAMTLEDKHAEEAKAVAQPSLDDAQMP